MFGGIIIGAARKMVFFFVYIKKKIIPQKQKNAYQNVRVKRVKELSLIRLYIENIIIEIGTARIAQYPNNHLIGVILFSCCIDLEDHSQN